MDKARAEGNVYYKGVNCMDTIHRKVIRLVYSKVLHIDCIHNLEMIHCTRGIHDHTHTTNCKVTLAWD